MGKTDVSTPGSAEHPVPTKPGRNRAVDAYRVVAMIGVTSGHWIATAVTVDADGTIRARNGLGEAQSMAWTTWIFQVMPLLFVVGGFAAATSLDSHMRDGSGRPEDWIARRLHRLVAPTALLAGISVFALALGVMTRTQDLAGVCAGAAAIPLWFLAHYTLSTAVTPWLLPRFRRNPRLVVAATLVVFVVVEALRYRGVSNVGHVNWVIGWLAFQFIGLAWHDGMLPTGRRLVTATALLWCAAVGVVALGPWPVSMVAYPGVEYSPTQPPSVSLLLFGAAQGATAVALAPALSRLLTRRQGAWRMVAAANSVAMSIYLWHMAAIVGAVLIAWMLGVLPTAAVGTAAWWLQKMPIIAIALLVVAGIVAVVAGRERDTVLERHVEWRWGIVPLIATAAAFSATLRLWSTGSPTNVALGAMVLLILWRLAFRPAVTLASAAADLPSGVVGNRARRAPVRYAPGRWSTVESVARAS